MWLLAWLLLFKEIIKTTNLGSGCGTAGTVVVSHSRDLQFESIYHYELATILKRQKVKKKRPGMGYF